MDAYDAMMETLAAGTAGRHQNAGWPEGSSVHDGSDRLTGQNSNTQQLVLQQPDDTQQLLLQQPADQDAERVATEMLDSTRTHSNAAAYLAYPTSSQMEFFGMHVKMHGGMCTRFLFHPLWPATAKGANSLYVVNALHSPRSRYLSCIQI